jgi:hypothetical protein
MSRIIRDERMTSNFSTVSLSTPLYLEISNFIEKNPQYRSVADFLSESARVRIEELTWLKINAIKVLGEAPNGK